MKFRHLDVPSHWEQYWTRYPEGYTILEALISWVSQVDEMVDNVNDWNVYLDNFVLTFDNNLQETVKNLLTEWKNEGILDEVIKSVLSGEVEYLYSEIASLKQTKVDKNGVEQINWGNLSQSVKTNITGGSTPVVGVDSVSTSNIVDGSVTAPKLAPNFNHKGEVNSGDLNTVTETGSYTVSGDVLNKPLTIGSAHLMVFNSAGGWVTQLINDVLDNKGIYMRSFRYVDGAITGNTKWVQQKTGNNNVALSTGVDLNSIGEDGTYLTVAGQNPNTPDTTSSFLITVDKTQGWVRQIANNVLDPTKIYIRTLRDRGNGAESVKPWQKISTNIDVQPPAFEIVSHLSGKKLLCLGDSLTDLSNYTATISSRTGMEVINGGVGGTRLANHSSADWDKFSITSLASAFSTGDWSQQDEANVRLSLAKLATLKSIDLNTVDYITIFSGTNDWQGTIEGGAVPIGVESDYGKETINGSVPFIVDNLLGAFPHLKITFVTPPYRDRSASGDNKNSDEFPNQNNEMLIDFGDTIIKQANNKHVPALDLYRNSNINKETAQFYTSDGLHLTDSAGSELIGGKIASFLLSCY